MKKRLLSLLLALILLIGIIPMSAISVSAEDAGGSALQMPTPQNVKVSFVGFVDAASGKAVVTEISWDALSSEVDGGNKFVEMWPTLKKDENLSLPMSFEAWMGQATLIPVEEMQEGGIGYVTIGGRSYLRSVVHILQPGELKVGDDGVANGVMENDVIDIDLYTAGYDPATQTDGESEHKHVEIVYTEENVRNKKTFTEEKPSECTHENKESESKFLNVVGNVTIDGKSTGAALVKETEECTDCHQKKTTKVYRLRFKNRRNMIKYLSGKYAKLKNGKTVHFKGRFEKVEKVYWNKKHIKVSKAYHKKKGSVILDFTDEFLAAAEDGTHELTVCNGDEFTAMTVTVQDHEMVEIGAFDVDDHAEISVDQYNALMQECEDNDIEVVDCDLDEFYADGFMVNADDREVTMNLSKDLLVASEEALELPAVTLSCETGAAYTEDEDYTLTYYQVVEDKNGEADEVEIAPEDIHDIGVYRICAAPTRNGVLFGESWAQFSIIDEEDCPHHWETACDERGHWERCTICGMTGRIHAHENWTVKSEIVRVDIPEGTELEESNLLCVTVYAECDDCGYQAPGAVYNVIHSFDAQSYPLATLRRAQLSEAGNAVYLDGDPDEDTYIFVDGVMVPADCIDMVYGVITDEFLATVGDGDHEVMVLNGTNFTVMTVTVSDHKMTAVKNKNLADYDEIDFDTFYDTIIEYFSAGTEIFYCDLDELLPLLGDIDGDGAVSILDVTWLQRKLARMDLPFAFIKSIADADSNGIVNSLDVTALQRRLAHMDAPEGIGLPTAYETENTVSGVTIKSVGVEIIGSTPNLMVVFANSTDKDIEFDCSKFTIVDGGTTYPISAGMRTMGKNRSYIQYAFTLGDSDISEGDTAEIYYDGVLIDTVPVTKS